MFLGPTTAPSLCDALGLEPDSFDHFLTLKAQAHAQKEAKAEQRAREAPLAKLVWAESCSETNRVSLQPAEKRSAAALGTPQPLPQPNWLPPLAVEPQSSRATDL